VDPYRIRRAISVGKWWLLAAAVLGGAAGLLISTFVIEQSYEASASVQYSGQPGDPAHQVQRDLPGLVAVARTEAVLHDWRDRVGGETEDASLEALREMLSVQSDPGNGMVSFTTWGHDPQETAEMANGAVASFLEHHEERRRAELEREQASLDERIGAAHDELIEARAAYDSFRRTNGITDISVEQESSISQTAELRSQADLGRAEVRALEARVEQLEGALAETPATRTVQTGSGPAQRRLQQLRQHLAEARGQGLGENHPRVQTLQRQVDSLEGSSAVRRGGARTSSNPVHAQLEESLSETRTELEAARQRLAALQELTEEASARTAEFGTLEGEAANLLAQVNVKQELLNELHEQRSSIEDELRDVETGFRRVAVARPPESAMPSKKKYAVAFGLPIAFIGIMLAMLLYRALRNRTVHTPREAAFWGNAAVVGTTTWPRDEDALIHLVADLDDHALDARGTMLLVGASEREAELATELANQLNHDWSSETLVHMPAVAALPPGAPADDEPAPDRSYAATLVDDGVLVGDVMPDDGPTELSLHTPAEARFAHAPTEVELDVLEAPRPVNPASSSNDKLFCSAWPDAPVGQALRRAARMADRVLVVVTSGETTMARLNNIRTQLGVEEGIGLILVGSSEDVIEALPDREGPVDEFWARISA